jgi:DNA recombination protein RmuC
MDSIWITAIVGLLGVILGAGLATWLRRSSDSDADPEVLAKKIEQSREQQQTALHNAISQLQAILSDKVSNIEKQTQQDASALREAMFERFEGQRQAISNSLTENRENQQQQLVKTLGLLSEQMRQEMKQTSELQNKQLESLTRTNDERLKEISGQVEKRLSVGFEKTTETFTKVLEHLTRIDEAQKRITELSGNVVSLQEVLNDKRSRGAFGEVQLSGLVANVLPADAYEMQATLSNGKRVDCLLKLPEPTGNVAIDAKFPLESYKRMMDIDAAEVDRTAAAAQFKKDIKKHIDDISSKYLIAGETADGAVMFIPAEAIFAEIHASFPDLVDESQRARVWMVSPTTLMAVLTTARAVLKDDATRKQMHIIQEHLRRLAEDFSRFQKRMDNLSKHIDQAQKDVGEIHTSASKISSRFEKIDKVEIQAPEDKPSSLLD